MRIDLDDDANPIPRRHGQGRGTRAVKTAKLQKYRGRSTYTLKIGTRTGAIVCI